jgi:sporulation protein YlmC with PRC-barrel domain
MVKRISELYGMDIFSNDAHYVGEVKDIILNLEKGEIVRLTTEPLRSVDRGKAKEILRDHSVLYNKVTAVKDIILVNQKGKKKQKEK